MFNKVSLIGYVGRDPESRFTKTGKQVTSFSVATDTSWGKEKKTVWFRVSVWGKLAEICDQYVTKGKLVYVEGTLSEPRVYQSKSGDWRSSLDVTGNTVKFLSKSGEVASEAPKEESSLEEEIPF